MILAYGVMIALFVTSIVFLIQGTLRHLNRMGRTSNAQYFLQTRQIEITEEESRGQLTKEESLQLRGDVEFETDTSKQQQSTRRLSFGDGLARWVVAGIVSFIGLSSVLVYHHLGYQKEVVFTQKFQAQALSSQEVNEFLSYRSQRYDRLEDWYYEASHYINSGDYEQAVKAFEKALEKLPNDSSERVRLLVEYAQALYYANGEQSSDAMLMVLDEILSSQPTQATALGLRGMAEFEQQNYLTAILTWQEAIRYNSNSADRLALLSAIGRARNLGNINHQTVAPIITDQVLVMLEWDTNNVNWQEGDVLLVYAIEKGVRLPIAIQKVFLDMLKHPILLTNLDAMMPTATLARVDKVDLIVKLSRAGSQDLTKGQVIGIKENIQVNRKEAVVVKVGL